MDAIVRKRIVMISIATAACLIGDSMLYVILPIYWKSVGLTSFWQVGVILSLNRLVRFLTNPAVGWFYRKNDIRTGLALSMMMTTVVSIGYAACTGFAYWCILRLIWGCAWSFLRIGGLATVTLVDSEHRGKMMGLYNGLYRIGSLIGTLLAAIVAPALGLHGIALLIWPLPLICLPVLRRLVNEPLTTAVVTPAKSKATTPWRYAKYTTLASGFVVSLIFQGAFTSTLSTAINGTANGEITILGMTLSAVFISGAMQSARWTWEPFLAVRFGKWTDGTHGRLPLYIVFLLVSGVCFFGLLSRSSLSLFIIVSFCVLITATGLTTITDSLASDVSRSAGVNSLSTYSMAQDMGAAVGPMLAYSLISIGGLGLMYSFMGSMLVCSAILWGLIRYKHDSRTHCGFGGFRA